MNLFHKIRLGFRALFHREKLDADMNDEIRSPFELRSGAGDVLGRHLA